VHDRSGSQSPFEAGQGKCTPRLPARENGVTNPFADPDMPIRPPLLPIHPNRFGGPETPASMNTNSNSPTRVRPASSRMIRQVLTTLLCHGWLTSAILADDGFPDLIIHRCQVFTLLEDQGTAEALAIKDGKILKTGRSSEVLRLRGPQTEVRDLRDKAIVPGFFVGPSDLSIELKRALMADCSPPPTGRVRAAVDVVTELNRLKVRLAIPADGWLAGYGYEEPIDDASETVNASSLDLAFPDNPVFVLLANNAGAVCNSLALAQLGITPETSDPPLGRIGRTSETRDERGFLWGEAWRQVANKLPVESAEGLPLRLEALQQKCLAAGITTVFGGEVDADTLQILRAADQQGALFLDFIVYRNLEEPSPPADEELASEAKPQRGRLQIGGTFFATEKESRARGFDAPKGDKDRKTSPRVPDWTPLTDAEVGKHLNEVIQQGTPVAIDCRSPEGLSALLRSLTRLRGSTLPAGSILRTHLSLVTKDLTVVSAAGLRLAFSPDDCYFESVGASNNLVDQDEFLGPLHRLAMSRKIEPLLFTRRSLSPQMVVFLWHSAVNRLSPDNRVIAPGERISPWQALQAISALPAEFTGREARVGRLEAGLEADFVVLDRNPYRITPTRIIRIQILETYKGGVRRHPQ